MKERVNNTLGSIRSLAIEPARAFPRGFFKSMEPYLNLLPSGIYVYSLGTNHEPLFANNPLAHSLGYQPADMNTTPPQSIFASAADFDELNRYFEQGINVKKYETDFINLHNERVPVLVSSIVSDKPRVFKNRPCYVVLTVEENLSIFDGLTGLYSRSYVSRCITKWSNRNDPQAYLTLFADVDGLKTVNDTSGHEAGDEILRLMTHILKESFRSKNVNRLGDILARWGGDEFLGLLPVSDPEDIDLETVGKLLRTRINQMLAQANPKLPELLDLSFGLALAKNATEIEKALNEADGKMYLEKQSHKNPNKPYPFGLFTNE